MNYFKTNLKITYQCRLLFYVTISYYKMKQCIKIIGPN